MDTQEAELSEADFQRISQLVYEHCRINLHEGKKELVRARIAKQMRTGGFGTASDYLEHVLADKSGREFSQLIDSLSTNLTSFFREIQHFDFLKQKLLPELVAQRLRAGTRRIRAWSAGCSTGEEPYSIAITLLENIPDHQGWDIKLLATDISTRVLEHASQGVYEPRRLEGVSQAIQQKYFSKVRGARGTPDGVRASDALRRIVAFRHLNLMAPWPFTGPFDFIFCRNVMIYFDKPTQQQLVQRYHDCLDRRGVLFTGHSESLTGIAHKFRYVQPTIYARP